MLAAEVWRWVAQSSWGGHSRYITLQHSIRLQACHVGCWPSFCGRGSGVAVSVHCQIPHKPGWINSVIFSAPPPLPLTITPPPPPRSNHRPFFPRVQCCQPHVQRHITLCAINYCHCKAFFLHSWRLSYGQLPVVQQRRSFCCCHVRCAFGGFWENNGT